MTRSHWWAKYVAIATVVVAAVILAAAYVAAATGVSVTAARTCHDLTWTVTNHWDSHIDGEFDTSIGYGHVFHLDPGQTATGSANVEGHLEAIGFSASGKFVNGANPIFTYSPQSQSLPRPADCPPPPTYVPPASSPTVPPATSPTTTPGVSSTAAPPPPASAAEPTTGPPDTTPVPARTTVPGAAGHPSTVAQQLPVTGMGENVLIFLIFAGSFAIVFGSILLTTRSRARD